MSSSNKQCICGQHIACPQGKESPTSHDGTLKWQHAQLPMRLHGNHLVLPFLQGEKNLRTKLLLLLKWYLTDTGWVQTVQNGRQDLM